MLTFAAKNLFQDVNNKVGRKNPPCQLLAQSWPKYKYSVKG
jgi:hypothetical protein